MTDTSNTIGARLRVLRKMRGLTLAQLAGLSGLSTSFLSMAERGQRALDRRSHIAALASALKVSETDLTGGPHLGTDEAQSGPHQHIPQLRTALETGVILHGDPVVERARDLETLVSLFYGPISHDRFRYDYLSLGALLPDVIDELNYHVSVGDEQQQKLALHTLVEAYMTGAGMARSLGYPDLGQNAAVRADQAATLLDDPVSQGKAAFALIRPNANNWGRVRNLAERAVDLLEPHAGDAGRPVLGMLTLNAALASASTPGGYGAAKDWLDTAAELATRVEDDMERNWQAFSATNVKVWRATISVEAGEAGASVRSQAALVDERKLAVHPARHASWLADVGRGLARDSRTRGESIGWLKRAEAVAPQRFRNDGKIRETVGVMLEQARVAAIGRDLRGIASRLGVPH